MFGGHIGRMVDGAMPVVTALSKGHTVLEKLANWPERYVLEQPEHYSSYCLSL